MTKDRYLFRGFHKEENGKETIYIDGQDIKGKWVFGSGAYNDKVMAFVINYDVDLIKETSEFEHIQVIPETIGQYTGLDDKNGKKIFENDVVKYKATYIRRKKQGIVLYDGEDMGGYEISKSLKEKDRICADIFNLSDKKWDCEVIKTIFDKEVKE